MGVGTGNPDGVNGGGVVYVFGQADPMIPAETTDIGGLPKLTTPIWLLYRMLLGSALADIGACASVVTSHTVGAVVPEFKIVGAVPVGGPTLIPYALKFVARYKLEAIHVLFALFPCKKE